MYTEREDRKCLIPSLLCRAAAALVSALSVAEKRRQEEWEWDGRSSDQITLATNLSPFEGRKEERREKRMKERSYAKARHLASEGIPTSWPPLASASSQPSLNLSALKDALAVVVVLELISCLPSFVPHFSRRDESLIRPRG